VITRGLSAHLWTLKAVQDYDVLLAAGRSQLLALEAERTVARVTTRVQEGELPPPYQALRWMVRARPLDPEEEQSPVAVTLTVDRGAGPSSAVRLHAIWPRSWVPDEWL
jgi:hypothetical protein